jgi:ABC-type multidrug transport system ATPase subunit
MEVVLENISKTFGRQVVISDLSHHFQDGSTTAVLGGNGSGKSTLLQLILGSLTPSQGRIHYSRNGNDLKRENAAFSISMASPYLELIEELTGMEFLNFYSGFRPFRHKFSSQDVLKRALLEDSSEKQIRHYSSGMRQRLRLAIALLSEAHLILLDEPSSNLDPRGVEWYRQLIQEERQGRTLIIGSNFDDREMDFCSQRLSVGEE